MSRFCSQARTKSTESEPKRDGLQARAGRVISGPLLKYINPSGGALKWCSLYFGGESRAGV